MQTFKIRFILNMSLLVLALWLPVAHAQQPELVIQLGHS
jgi:hypothetical protein